MKVSECEKCEHYERRKWSHRYCPGGYHPIGMTHAYGYCTLHQKRCCKVKGCAEVLAKKKVEEMCDAFEVVRWDGYTFHYGSFKEAYDRWLGDGYQNVSSKMYGLKDGKRIAIMTGYHEGKNPEKLEMELITKGDK